MAFVNQKISPQKNVNIIGYVVYKYAKRVCSPPYPGFLTFRTKLEKSRKILRSGEVSEWLHQKNGHGEGTTSVVQSKWQFGIPYFRLWLAIS